MEDIDVTITGGPALPVVVTSIFEPTPSALAAAAQVGGGAFAAGAYYWVVTGTDAFGETLASNEATAVIVLNGSCILTWGPLPPGTTGVKVYRGTAPGAENALIATLGAVLTYTDTGGAGTVFSPPIKNTAEIGSQVIVSGRCILLGWGIREKSYSIAVDLSIRNGGQEVAPLTINAGFANTQWLGPTGVLIRNELIISVNSGTYSGSVYVQYLD
jgi:hypothetical protein